MKRQGIRSFFISLFLIIASFLNVANSSFVVDGYTKIYGHMCPDEKTPEGYAKLAAFYRKNNFVVDDITNQIEYIPKKPQ